MSTQSNFVRRLRRAATEPGPLPKRPVASRQPAPSRRGRFYSVGPRDSTNAPVVHSPDDGADPPDPRTVVLGCLAWSACALGASGILGNGALANGLRVIAGLGLVGLGVLLLRNRHDVRARLAPRLGSRTFTVLGGLFVFAGGGAVVVGLVQLLVDAPS